MPVGQESPWRGIGLCADAVAVAGERINIEMYLYMVVPPDCRQGSTWLVGLREFRGGDCQIVIVCFFQEQSFSPRYGEWLLPGADIVDSNRTGFSVLEKHTPVDVLVKFDQGHQGLPSRPVALL